MSRVVKRQSEDELPEISDAKKIRLSDNLLKFEQMKAEAEENRRRVRDQYLKEYEASLLIVNNSSSDSPTATAPTVRAEPAAAVVRAPKSPGRRKSTSSAEVKPRTPKAKPPVDVNSPAKPTVTRPRKTPSKSLAVVAAALPAAVENIPTEIDSASNIPEVKQQSECCVDEGSGQTHISSADVPEEEEEDMESDADWCGQLYPSIALSDSFNAVGHLYAAFLAFSKGQTIAGMGFIAVWLAAMMGVLRFGVSEKLFAQANCDLSNLAGIVGYPLIGMSFAKQFQGLGVDIDLVVLLGVLVAWEALTRSFLDKNRDNAKLATNIIFFVGPIAAVCHNNEDYDTLAALFAFVVAGVVITPHHENRIFGVRCVDWFHYTIGATAVMFAKGLASARV